MKLILCPSCEDIVKLTFEKRNCECGKVSGFYHKDGIHATVIGPGACVGIDNNTFVNAYHMMKDSPALTQQASLTLLNFRAWIFHPQHAPRVKYKNG